MASSSDEVSTARVADVSRLPVKPYQRVQASLAHAGRNGGLHRLHDARERVFLEVHGPDPGADGDAQGSHPRPF